MVVDKALAKKIKAIADSLGGYLTAALYDENRGDLPSWDTLRSKYNITFKELLESLKILSKEEYLIRKNRIKAISNFKIINLEYGYVSKKLYDELKYSPSSDYISTHYGWVEIAKEAGAKLDRGQYTSIEELIAELKNSIKVLGYIPTSTEYRKMSIKPSQDSLSSWDITWTEAMKKAGYRPYGKSVLVHDKVCDNDDCYRQFTPTEDQQILCNQCYKELRAKLAKSIKNMNRVRLEEVCQKLIYNGNTEKNIIELTKTIFE